jgi:Ig-like domain-containing protein/helix-turn-helix protein
MIPVVAVASLSRRQPQSGEGREQAVADQPAKTRADAIEAFAAMLRSLRESVGNPSFREMSGRSRAISHTTLHEAAQGHRLPSWATTAEFVKACGADPAEYRERWRQADQLIKSVNSLNAPARDSQSRSSAGTAIPAAGGPDRRTIQVAIGAEPAQLETAAEVDGDRVPVPRRRRLRFALTAVAVVCVIAVAAVVAVLTVWSGRDSPGGNRHAPDSKPKPALSPADCPVHQRNPPAAAPAHPGDASAFVADITLPDCSHIQRGQTAIKVWRLKNVGKVPWLGYSLRRLDSPQQSNECQTIADVPIDNTPPGHLVDIRTEITAPKSPGFCFARFKMVDASGRLAFPGSRPVNFQVIVD